MRRVVILGPGGSGKSTFALHLAEITGLHVIEQPGLVATPRDQWVEVQRILIKESC
jgi:adenylate kinase family enzyme